MIYDVQFFNVLFIKHFSGTVKLFKFCFEKYERTLLEKDILWDNKVHITHSSDFIFLFYYIIMQ